MFLLNKLEFFNEICILIVSYHLFLFTNVVDDPLIHPEASKEIAEAVPGAKYYAIEGMGHGILKPTWSQLTELIDQHTKTV